MGHLEWKGLASPPLLARMSIAGSGRVVVHPGRKESAIGHHTMPILLVVVRWLAEVQGNALAWHRDVMVIVKLRDGMTQEEVAE